MRIVTLVTVLVFLGGCAPSPTAPGRRAGQSTVALREAVSGSPLQTLDGSSPLVFAGYLGNQPIYKNPEGAYFQADLYKPDGSPASYAPISGFSVFDITPTNQTGTKDRGK